MLRPTVAHILCCEVGKPWTSEWRGNKSRHERRASCLATPCLPVAKALRFETTVVHSSSECCPRFLGNLREFRNPQRLTDNCTVGPARVSRLHKRSLSFTLQFKKNFKLARLLNTGALAKKVPKFRAACPPACPPSPPPPPRWMMLVAAECVRVRDLAPAPIPFTVAFNLAPAREGKRRKGCRTSPDRCGLGRADGRKGRKQPNPLAFPRTCSRRGAAWSQV